MLIPQQDVMLLKVVNSLKAEGIMLPESFEPETDESAIFEILAVGEGYYLDSGTFIQTKLKTGDKVILASYGLSKFKYNGSKVLLGRARDVMLKVEEKEVNK